MNDENLIPAPSVAAQLGVKTGTLAKWRRLGLGPKGWIRRGRTVVIYPASAVAVYQLAMAAEVEPPEVPSRRVMTRREWTNPDGVVYFIQENGPGGSVKIGFTRRDPAERINTMQPGNPRPLKVIGFFYGDERQEQHLHGVFASSRISGEWFTESPELLALVARVNGERLSADRDEVRAALEARS